MRRALATWAAVGAAGLSLSACSEVSEPTEAGYDPSKLEAVDGSELKRVTFTAEGAQRTGLRTSRVRRSGDGLVVDYEALIYDGTGKPYVYTSPKALTFQRAAVEIERIEGDRVLLTDGPPAGTRIVTVGASLVYGSELEMEGGH
jgi:hypothetical protein